MKRVFLTVLLFLSFSIYAQTSKEIDFYGVLSSDIDENMQKMTEDLYYNQLRDFSGTINDFRYNKQAAQEIVESIINETTIFDRPTQISFVATIKKLEDELSKWECKLYLKCTEENKILVLTKEYDSYYKILMESKTEVASVMKNFSIQKREHITLDAKSDAIGEKTKSPDIPQPAQIASRQPQENASDIFGTWTGEEGISKAVIMRGGRGFVIFRDGAAMNVQVSIQQNDGKKTITVKQSGNSNASYFPEIKRSDALEKAKTAEPIEWELQLVSENTLSGKKKTLLEDATTGKIKNGTIDVEWVRK